MGDLISRAAALDAIDGMKPMQGNMEQLAMKALCWAAGKTIPAVDAAQIVRCKDCVYYNTTGCGVGFGWCEGTIVNTGVSDDFYCASGERRDSE